MSAASALVEGQTLVVPAGVSRSGHNISTFRPYDASDAVGDASPTNPKMPKKNKCGMMGQIMLVAVSLAVSFALPAIAPGVFGTFLGSMGAAAIGSAVSQGVGIATGIQDKFSWKSVAMAGIAAGVGGAVGRAFGETAVAGSKIVTDALRGAMGSAITQGIGVATGLQSKFDFAGVAAAGLGAAAGGLVGRKLEMKYDAQDNPLSKPSTWNNPDGLGHNAVIAGADAIGQATARSLVEGTSFGDNLVAALPSAIGNTIGGAIGRSAVKALNARRTERLIAAGLGSEDMRGTKALAQTIREGVEAGLSSGEIRRLLSSEGGRSQVRMRHFANTLAETRIENKNIQLKAGISAEAESENPPLRFVNLVVGFDDGQTSDDRIRDIFGLRRRPPSDGSLIRGIPFPDPLPPPADQVGGSGVFGSLSPTETDRAHERDMRGFAAVARLAGYSDMANHMDHFLDGSGRTRTVNVGRMLDEIPSFRTQADDAFRGQVMNVVRRHIAAEFRGQEFSGVYTSPWVGSEGAPDGNWHLALGQFDFAQSASYRVTPDGRGGVNVSIGRMVHVFDRYDWIRNKTAVFDLPVIGRRVTFRDNDQRRLVATGLARDFEIRSSAWVGSGEINISSQQLRRIRGQ